MGEGALPMTGGSFEMDGFSLGEPALVCRWRLAGGKLALLNRHMRALSKRCINGQELSPELVAWVKQRVEWTLADGAKANPDGVLMLVVDKNGCAALTVGPYEPLVARTAGALADRAASAAVEAASTRVAPETLWTYRDGVLHLNWTEDAVMSGSASLIAHIAGTIGMSVVRDTMLLPSVREGFYRTAEIFLVSDEHGVVIAQDHAGDHARRFADGYQKLLSKTRA